MSDPEPATPGQEQHMSSMSDIIVVPAKWSVPRWDVLQPVEWLRAAAQNIWRLFLVFMQHMFCFKLNSEKMCIIIG